jgi:hypothetical protein
MVQMMVSRKKMNDIVSKLPEVRDAVHNQAEIVAAKAEGILAQHRDNSDNEHHEITLTHGDVDSFVNLEGPAPMSVEFGHYIRMSGGFPRYVVGLYILHRAAGLI